MNRRQIIGIGAGVIATTVTGGNTVKPTLKEISLDLNQFDRLYWGFDNNYTCCRLYKTVEDLILGKSEWLLVWEKGQKAIATNFSTHEKWKILSPFEAAWERGVIKLARSRASQSTGHYKQ